MVVQVAFLIEIEAIGERRDQKTGRAVPNYQKERRIVSIKPVSPAGHAPYGSLLDAARKAALTEGKELTINPFFL